jgi:hypothetical protein
MKVLGFVMSRMEKSKKTYRCALVMHITAKDGKNAAEQFLNVIGDGWVKPNDVIVKAE